MELCCAAFSGIFFGIFYRYKCLLANKLKLCVVKIYSKTNGKEFRINYNLNCNTKNVVYLITCRVCGIQYVGSTTTTFRSRFNNHRSRINAHLKLSSENKRNDDFLYQHFHSSGHLGLSHLTIQLIDRAMGERELRKKEGQWMYRLGTLRPQGLKGAMSAGEHAL